MMHIIKDGPLQYLFSSQSLLVIAPFLELDFARFSFYDGLLVDPIQMENIFLVYMNT